MPLKDRAQVLSQLAATLSVLDAAEPLTWRIGESARRMLDCDGAAITLDYTLSSRVTLSTTDDISERLEDLQDVLGEGPGHDAYRRAQIVTAFLDEAAESRWPNFVPAATEAFGPLAIHAVPMVPHDEAFGVLTTYTRELRELATPGEFARLLADTIGAALLRDPRSQSASEDIGSGSWSSRAPINQAVGMIVAQLGIRPDDALAILRAHAFARNTDLLAIALETIERRINFSNFTVSGD